MVIKLNDLLGLRPLKSGRDDDVEIGPTVVRIETNDVFGASTREPKVERKE